MDEYIEKCIKKGIKPNKYITTDYDTLKIHYTILLKYVMELERRLQYKKNEIEKLNRIIEYYKDMEMNSNEIHTETQDEQSLLEIL